MIPRKEGCTMKLSFLDAAGEVRGSCLRVGHEQGSLLVDCGMFQGGRVGVRQGVQAQSPKGRRSVDGMRQVSLFGERGLVRAQVHTIGGLSAHADQPALLDWMAHFKQAPGKTFVVHGELLGAQALADAIHQRLGWAQPIVP